MHLALPARAKLNTSLEVRGRLPDGRHELRTEFVAISLSDLVELETSAVSELTLSGLPLPAGENLVEKARAELEAAAGRRLPARIRVHKRIPPGAGLGGGSSDAATAMRGLVRLHGLELELEPVARRVGADVAFFLCGGSAGAGGAGDDLEPSVLPKGCYALAWPGYGVSTAAVYEAYDRLGGGGRNHLRRAAEAVEPRLAGFAAELGAGWEMTGSGSAFFRHRASEADARAAVSGLGCWTAVARPVGRWC